MAISKITANSIADNSLTAANVSDGSITTTKLADSAVTSAKIGVDVIVAEDLAANSVTVSELTDGAVTPAKLSTGHPNWDSAGNVGIGVTPSSGKLHISPAPGTTSVRIDAGGTLSGARRNWGLSTEKYTAGAFSIESGTSEGAAPSVARMTIDSSGNVGIGTVSPSSYNSAMNNLVAYGSGDSGITIASGTASEGSLAFADGTTGNEAYRGWINYNHGSDFMRMFTAGSERMRIDSSGQVGIGVSPYAPLTVAYSKASDVVVDFRNTSGTSPYGLRVGLTGATPNNASQYFITCPDSTNTKATLYSNGGLANYQANDTNLSDAREKTDLEDSKNYLDVICSIPVKTFKYIDQTDEDRTLGVIAQDVQEVAPELVSEDDWGTPENPKVRLGIYQTDFQYALMKSIQELKTLVDTQQQTIESLEARVATLESA